MDTNTIDRLIELVSDKAAALIWQDLEGYKKVKGEDAIDARNMRRAVENAIDTVYGMEGQDLVELVAALDEIDGKEKGNG